MLQHLGTRPVQPATIYQGSGEIKATGLLSPPALPPIEIKSLDLDKGISEPRVKSSEEPTNSGEQFIASLMGPEEIKEFSFKQLKDASIILTGLTHHQEVKLSPEDIIKISEIFSMNPVERAKKLLSST